VLSVIGVGDGVEEQTIGKSSAFAEGGNGPGKFIPHHAKSAVSRAVTLVPTVFLTVVWLLSVFMFGVGCEGKFCQ
jgi:hypothetical protein